MREVQVWDKITPLVTDDHGQRLKMLHDDYESSVLDRAAATRNFGATHLVVLTDADADAAGIGAEGGQRKQHLGRVSLSRDALSLFPRERNEPRRCWCRCV